MLDIGQERGHHPEKRQIRADPGDELDSVPVGESAEHGRADTADPEGETEEQARHCANLAGHQLLGEYHDGGECGGQYESDDETQGAGPREIGHGQENRERSDAEYRKPDDPRAADAVAEGAAQQSAERHREQEYEQIDLRRSHGYVKFLDQVEAVETGDAGDAEEFRDYQHHQDADRPADPARRHRPGNGGPALGQAGAVEM